MSARDAGRGPDAESLQAAGFHKSTPPGVGSTLRGNHCGGSGHKLVLRNQVDLAARAGARAVGREDASLAQHDLIDGMQVDEAAVGGGGIRHDGPQIGHASTIGLDAPAGGTGGVDRTAVHKIAPGRQGRRQKLRRLVHRTAIDKGYRGQAWGLEMYRVLAASRITLNVHIDMAGPAAVNMRMYEATGVGTLLLTDDGVNLSELFEAGKEVVTYRTPQEAAEKVHYFLEHENERMAIAKAGQQRTLQNYTYDHVIGRMLDCFRGVS